MTATLSSSRRQQRQHKRLARLARKDVRRRAETRGYQQAAVLLATYQADAMDVSIDFLPQILVEQGLRSGPVGRPSVQALVSTTTPVVRRMEVTDTAEEFERLVATLVADAARDAAAIAAAAEPEVTAYVRQVAPPCCGRCAILAGRIYRWSTGFERHPQCDCDRTATNSTLGRDLLQDPTALFEQGGIRGLSRADVLALNNGADLAQLVNVRSKKAGLTVGGSVLERRGRPTPAGIFAGNPTKEEAIAALRRWGYLI